MFLIFFRSLAWVMVLAGGLVWASAGAMAATPAGDTIRDVRVEGNQRIESRTVVSYLGLASGSQFSQAEIDSALKNLFATGFFADVKLLRDGATLVVRVTENPMINNVAFEGNQRIETKDLEKELELQPRAIFAREKVQNDVKRILDIYRRSGRYNATVMPKVIKQDQNRVDLVYEISEGEVARVANISFIGNNHFSASALRDVIRTEETRWYKFLTDNDKYDSDRSQFDQELLRRFYTSEGYIDFQVKSIHAELTPAKDAFYLTYVLDEGMQYQFGDVTVTSELKDGDKPEFGSLITTHKGDTYDSTKVEATIDAMTKELGDRGYAFVDIQPRIERDKEKKLANLSYVITPGPRVYVERINITGNVRTLDEVIRREFRLSEGDPYNSSKLQRTEQRLNNLGYFEKVEVKNESGSAPDRTAINVDVQEKSTGEVNIGAGYSSTQGVIGDFGISENNLLGRGQQLKFNFTYGARIKQQQISFTEPYFLNRDVSAGFDIFNIDQSLVNRNTYSSTTKGFALRGGYSLQEKWMHNVSYSLRESDIRDVSTDASAYIRQQEGKQTNSSISHALTYDDRDNKFSPTTGYFLKLSQEFAGLGGDSRYLKHEIKTSYYYPIAPHWVFSVLASGGNVFGWGNRDVRINDRFFVGGDDLRGFDNGGIGARDRTTLDALGGTNYYVGTTELRFPLGLPDEVGLSGAVFTDVGSLWSIPDKSTNIFDDSAPRVSAGVGALWTSPFGPIRVDVVHAFVKEDPDRTQSLHFSFGTRF